LILRDRLFRPGQAVPIRLSREKSHNNQRRPFAVRSLKEDAVPSSLLPSGLRAVLFDFDGTLGDSYPAITASVNHVRALYQLPPLAEAEVRHYVGRGPEYLLRHTVGRGDVMANIAAYRAHHPSVLRTGTRLLPDAVETLRTLHDHGLHLAVCSNKPVVFTRQLLEYLAVADYLEVVLGPEDVARPKPAPDMILAALERLRLPATAALYVGDMTVDIETARAAGVSVWVVATGSDDLEALTQARPDRILKSLRELTAD
jgi:phosphoglycolate phosphatase